jgi:hypothetical protein
MSQSKLSREEFERNFKQVNASWGYEDAQLDDQGKELLFKRLNGDINEEEFQAAVQNLLKQPEEGTTMNYKKLSSGIYQMSNALSAAEAVVYIKQIIDSEGGKPPLRFNFENGTEGFADGIGMGLSQQFGIQVEFDQEPRTKMLAVFYLERQ